MRLTNYYKTHKPFVLGNALGLLIILTMIIALYSVRESASAWGASFLCLAIGWFLSLMMSVFNLSFLFTDFNLFPKEVNYDESKNPKWKAIFVCIMALVLWVSLFVKVSSEFLHFGKISG